MTTIILSIVILIAMAIVVVLLFKPYDYGANAGRFEQIEVNSANRASESDDTRWRSVKIRPGLIACERVASLQDQLFLSREAPRLPLANCDEQDCRCHYIFHEDRRSGQDRRAKLDKLGRLLSGKREDRRRSPGRRIGDPAAV